MQLPRQLQLPAQGQDEIHHVPVKLRIAAGDTSVNFHHGLDEMHAVAGSLFFFRPRRPVPFFKNALCVLLGKGGDPS